jgi:flagellar M-ring protein FliF
VQVAAELDYTQSELFQETYDGENPAPRSEQTSEEISMGNNDDAQGIPGARANVVGGPAQGAQFQGEGGDRRTAKTTNYELNKTTKREVAQLGRLKRLTVAVLIDGVRTTDADGAETVTERPQEELERIQGLVRSAIGFTEARGDEVTVVSMGFTPTPEEDELNQVEVMEWQDYLQLLWKPVIGFLFVLVLVGIMFSMRKMGDPGGVPTPILESPQSVRDLEAALTAAGQGAALAGSADAQLAAAAMKSSRPDPEKAAAVIKGWLTEG